MKFKKHTVTATVMCAGNRRSEMNEIKIVKGLEAVVEHIQFEGGDCDVTGSS